MTEAALISPAARALAIKPRRKRKHAAAPRFVLDVDKHGNMDSYTIVDPTPEFRTRNAEKLDEPIVDQMRCVRAWRLVGVLERLLKSGAISPEQYAAGERYGTDHHLAALTPPVTPSYGLRAAEGTPVGQQIDGGRTDPIDVRIRASERIAAAHRAMVSQPTIDAVIMATTTTASLEEIGRAVLSRSNKVQALTAAQERVVVGLDLLARHYDDRSRTRDRERIGTR